MTTTHRAGGIHSCLVLAGWLALSFSAAALGGFFTPGEWYATLRKPAWNPPNWIFGPMWTLLYILMAIAAWRVWRCGGWSRQRRPLAFFLTQLLLNAAWSPLFFGARQPGWAMLDLVLLWLALAATLDAFLKVDRAAGLLLVPYLAWVTFAGTLNFTLWRLNV